VVVNNFNIESMPSFEPKTNPPLAIDTDAPFVIPVTREFF
jgi:hypothetical protein